MIGSGWLVILKYNSAYFSKICDEFPKNSQASTHLSRIPDEINTDSKITAISQMPIF